MDQAKRLSNSNAPTWLARAPALSDPKSLLQLKLSKQSDACFGDHQVPRQQHKGKHGNQNHETNASGDQETRTPLASQHLALGHDVRKRHDKVAVEQTIDVGGAPNRLVQHLQQQGQAAADAQAEQQAETEDLAPVGRSEEHTSELQSRLHLVCRLLLEKKKKEETESPDHKDIIAVRCSACRYA